MTNEEICRLMMVEGSSEELKTQLWEQVENLYYMNARKHYWLCKNQAIISGVEIDDCYQVCYFAFLDALDDYIKEQRTVKFTSFAGFHIRNHINNLLGLRVKKNDPLNQRLSLDAPFLNKEGKETTFSDMLPDKKATEDFEDIELNDIYVIIDESVESLDAPQREVIKARYYECKGLKDVSNLLLISESEIRRLENRALHSLRNSRKIKDIGYDYYGVSTGLRSYIQNRMSSVEILAERKERKTKIG